MPSSKRILKLSAVGWGVAALLAACAGTPGGVAKSPPVLDTLSFRFAPGTTAYLASSHRVVERTARGRTLSDSVLLEYQVTTVITEVDAALSAAFVIDTVFHATARNLSERDIGQSTGVTFSAHLHPTGRLEDLTGGNDSNPLLGQLATQIAVFFPTLPRDGLSPGSSWVDTAETQSEHDGALLTINAVTAYQSREWDETDGTVVLPVHWERTYRVEGGGNQFGQRFSVRGDGTTTGQALFRSDGRYYRSLRQDSLAAELFNEAQGTVTPVRQRQIDIVRLLQ